MSAFHEQRHYPGSYPLSIHPLQEMDFLAHYHEEIELLLISHGSQNLGINNQLYSLSAGQIGLVAPWHIHYYEKPQKECASGTFTSGYLLIFSSEILGYPISWQSAIRTFDPKSRVFLELSDTLSALEQEMNDHAAYFELAASSLLHQFIVRLLRSDRGQTSLTNCLGSQKGRMLMQDILSYIARYYCEPLNRASLCKQFGISPSHFSRLFAAATGLSFTEYLSRLRVKEAREKIRNSPDSITEIALCCGFESIRTFNRCYKRITGQTPSAERQAVGAHHT